MDLFDYQIEDQISGCCQRDRTKTIWKGGVRGGFVWGGYLGYTKY